MHPYRHDWTPTDTGTGDMEDACLHYHPPRISINVIQAYPNKNGLA